MLSLPQQVESGRKQGAWSCSGQTACIRFVHSKHVFAYPVHVSRGTSFANSSVPAIRQVKSNATLKALTRCRSLQVCNTPA